MSEARELAAHLRATDFAYTRTFLRDAAALIERQAERIEALEAELRALSVDAESVEYQCSGNATAQATGRMMRAKIRALLAPAPGKETTT